MSLNVAFFEQLAKGLAKQFGEQCEVVLHDLTTEDFGKSIILIENGHVTNRKVGDGPSHVVLETLHGDPAALKDHLGYLTRTSDGRILKSSTMYIRDEEHPEKVIGIFAINYDITGLLAIDSSIKSLIASEPEAKEPERITTNVSDLLDDLIEQSVALVGKPVALMTKDDKVRAIQFLNEYGAFLITKSGEKISKYFGISKYTLYSYIDINKQH